MNFGSQVRLNDIYRRHLVKDASELHYMLAGRLAGLAILGIAVAVVYKVDFMFRPYEVGPEVDFNYQNEKL